MEVAHVRVARKRLDFRNQATRRSRISLPWKRRSYPPIVASLEERDLYMRSLKHDASSLLAQVTGWSGYYAKYGTPEMMPRMMEFHKKTELILFQVTKLLQLMADIRLGENPHVVFDPGDELKRATMTFMGERKTVHTNLSSEHTYLVNGSPLALYRAFMNILRNASEVLGPEGEVTINSSDRSFEKAEFVMMLFSDNGPGMDQKTLDLVFNSGFTTKETGQGLGLYVVRQSVKEFHGMVDVESTLGEGTTFTLMIPAAIN
jgi:signal transduction histidine kinase